MLGRGLLHLDLVRTNMHKVFVVGMYMVPSLLVFAATGQVRWLAGAALAVGTSIGGWIGTTFQISRGDVVRVVFAVAVVAWSSCSSVDPESAKRCLALLTDPDFAAAVEALDHAASEEPYQVCKAVPGTFTIPRPLHRVDDAISVEVCNAAPIYVR